MVILLQSIFTDIIQYSFPRSSCLVIKFCTYLIDGCLLVSCGGSKGTEVCLSSAFYSFHPVVTFQLFSCFSPQTSQPGPSKEKHKTHQASKPPVPHIYTRRKICRRKGGGDSDLFPPFVLNVEEEFLLKHKNLLYSQSLYIITVAKWYKIKYILSVLSSIHHLYMCVFQHSRKTLKETENKSMGHHSVQLWVFKNSLLAGLFCVTDSTKTTC